MMAPAFLVAAAILFAPVIGRAEAWSGSVPAKARELAEHGRAFHDAGDYPKAIAAFTQAYAMAPSPALLFNLAQAYRLQGNCDDAAVMYRRYLATNPRPEGHAIAEVQLARVELCLQNKLSREIPIDTQAAKLVVPPPPEAVELTAGASAPPHKAQLEQDIGLGLALGGGVALAAAAYYAVQARNAANDVAAGYAMHAKWKDIAPIDTRGKAAATKAQRLGAGGALGIATGIAMYLIGRHTAKTAVTVAPAGRGVEVGMSWAF
jgi:hypothetical protein